MLGVVRDPIFGRIITFGAGGHGRDLQRPRRRPAALNNASWPRTRSVDARPKLLGEFRNMPPADVKALEDVLLCISEMVCELPWLQELDLNPLIVDENGAIAADAHRHRPRTASGDRYSHMAIHLPGAPQIQEWQLPDGRWITIRPIRPGRREMEKDSSSRMSDESKYYRFMDTIRELTQPMLVRFTQIDYDREMALVATVELEDGKEQQIGVSRYVTNPDGRSSAEFALAVADDWQKHGVGRKLMTALIECARMKGYRAVVGDVLALNTKMFRLMTSLGFTIHPHPDDAAVKRVVKPLQG